MKFQLMGGVWYATGSCHNDKSVEINEEFEKDTVAKAIRTARQLVQKYHKRYSYLSDYGCSAKLCIIKTEGKTKTEKTIWETHFVNERPAEPAQLAIPAKPAKPAVPAHFKEEKTTKN